MSEAGKKRKGRPPKFVRDHQGREIHGLSYHKSSESYYATFEPSIRFGRDFDLAVMRFRQWQAEQGKQRLHLGVPFGGLPGGFTDWQADPSPEVGEFWSSEHEVIVPIGQGDLISVPPEIVWKQARTMILKDPLEASKQLGIPEIAHLRDLPPLEPSLTLQRIGEMYFDRRDRRVTPNELAKSRMFWEEFCQVIGVTAIHEIRANHINRYRDRVCEAHHHGKSTTYVRHRFGKVKTILRHALRQVDHPQDISHVLTLCVRLSPPRAVEKPAVAIDRDDFHALLAAADLKWRAMLLVSLNCAYYMIDAITLPRIAVNPETGVVTFPRGKTGIMRLAVLWPRTLTALQAYLSEHGHNSRTVFTSKFGKPYNRYGAAERFQDLRRKAGLDDSVKFAHIRDGAASAAFHAGAAGCLDTQYLDVLLGHRIRGEKVKYISLNPAAVRPVCEAIEAHYFEDNGTAAG